MAYEIVIGLEVHAELNTRSKIFCSCSAKRGAEQNQSVCPACCGMPGMLPIANKQVVNLAMTAGFLTNCNINRVTTFDKKNYYYPDLPSSYQTTQWFQPICVDGFVEIEVGGETKRIGIKQIHMEEDAGKLVHDDATDTTLVDFNRTSVPLIEIVSGPDLRSVEEVLAYLNRLRTLLRYGKVSGARFEEGTMRCDVNISVRPEGAEALGVRTELKNMNSLSAIARAIEYETQRHIDAIEYGTEQLVQETRGWDDQKGRSFAMRNKETAADYRYFPDPNLQPIVIDDDWYNRIKAELPVLPEVLRERFQSEYGLRNADADQLVSNAAAAELFLKTVEKTSLPKETATWIIEDIARIMRRMNMSIDGLTIDAGHFAHLIRMVAEGSINRALGRKALDALVEKGIDPAIYLKENAAEDKLDDRALLKIVDGVLSENEDTVMAFLGGRDKARQALVGAVMRALKGQGDPAAINRALDSGLEKYRGGR